MRRGLLACVIAALGLSLAVTSPAAATGQLTAYLGALPDGTAVPAGPWTNLNSGSTAGGPFGVMIPDGVGLGWAQAATLSVPTGLTFASATADRSYWAPVMSAVGQPGFSTSFESAGWPYESRGCVGHEWDPCPVASSGDGIVTRVPNPSVLALRAQCTGAGGSDPNPRCTAGTSWVARRMALTLNDATDPIAQATPSTPLLSGDSTPTSVRVTAKEAR